MNKIRTIYADGSVVEHTYIELAEICGISLGACSKAVSRGTLTKKMKSAGIRSITKLGSIKGFSAWGLEQSKMKVWLIYEDGTRDVYTYGELAEMWEVTVLTARRYVYNGTLTKKMKKAGIVRHMAEPVR